MAWQCELFVSGRLALFGEHSDWAGEHSTVNPEVLPGRTLLVGTKEGVYARAKTLKEKVRRCRLILWLHGPPRRLRAHRQAHQSDQ
jgi:hypothetical protein